MPHELDLLSAPPHAHFAFDDLPPDPPSDADPNAPDDSACDLASAVPHLDAVMGAAASRSSGAASSRSPTTTSSDHG